AQDVERAFLLEEIRPITLRVLRAGTERITAVAPQKVPSPVARPRLSPPAEAELAKATAAALQGRPEGLERLGGGPLEAAAQSNLGVSFELQDRLELALAAYQHARRMAPYEPLYHLNLGLALRKIGNFERAAEELEFAVRLDPKSLAARARLAEVYSLLG